MKRWLAVLPLGIALSMLFGTSCGGGGGGSSTAPSATAGVYSVSKDLGRSILLEGRPANPGNALTFQISANPKHGSLSGTAPHLVYTPNLGFIGKDELGFRVTENGILSAEAIVQLLVTDWRDISPSGGLVSTAAFHPTLSSQLWVSADDGGGLYKSVDTGQSWTLQKGTPINWSAYTLVFDPSNASILYAPNHFGRGLLVSSDGGSTWSQTGSGLPTTGEQAKRIDDLAVDPTDGKRLWAATRSGLFRSLDSGKNFAQVTSTAFGTETDFRAVEISSGGRIFVCSKGGGLYDSQNGGTSWSVIASPSGLLPTDLALTANAVYVAFGPGWITRAAGFVASNYTVINDPTKGGIQSTVWTRIEAASGATVAQDKLYVGTTWVGGSSNWGFHSSANGGGSFTRRVTGLGGASTFDLVLDPSNSSRLMLTSVNDGVFLTTNAGTTWAPISTGIHAYDSLGCAEDPKDGGHLLFTSGAAFPGTSKTLESKDGGQTWSEIGSLANIDVLEIHFVPASSTEILLTTHNAGLYRTTGGTSGTWTKVLSLTTNLKNLVFSPADATRVYAIAANPLTDPQAGIYFSGDSGATWTRRFTNDIPNSVFAVSAIPHPSNKDEVVITGSDVWVTTDALATGRAGTRSLGLATFAPGKFFNSAAFHPTSSSTLLVGTSSGELYRTDNYSATGTVTWRAVPTIAKDAWINDIHIIKDAIGETWLLTLWNGDTSFVSTSTTGILRSDDQGQSWTFLEAGLFPCSMTWKLRARSSSPRSFLVGLWGAAGLYALDI